MATLLADKYEARKAEVNARFEQLRANEEELNRIFAKIYNMEGEVPIEVEDKYVSVARIFDTADEIPESYKGNKYVRTKRDEIASLMSYAVGCMFGRYSLDVDGLVLADQGATVDDYLAKMPDPDHVTFMPDGDNVLPITDDEYFDDDIVRYFIDFVRTVYGEETLEQNLAFIAEALGGKGTSREVIRTYFLKDFFKDHCQTYKKRPILAVRLGQKERLYGPGVHASLHARLAGAHSYRLRARAAGALSLADRRRRGRAGHGGAR